jgi:hypothetical protein
MKSKTTKTNKAQKSSLRNKNEQTVLAKLGLVKNALAGKLNAQDHIAIAKAARAASQLLRKSDPSKASDLYYVFYKHTKLVGKPLEIARLSRKAPAKVKAVRKHAAPKTAPAVPVTAEAVAA